MKPRVAIIDYGMGNLYSVRNTFAALGLEADILEGADALLSYDKLILPGVGAFGDAMKELQRRKFIAPLRSFVAAGRSLLGICLGMQLLFEKSAESKGTRGLGLIAGNVRKFSSRLKCPHMGWNRIEKRKSGSKIFKGLGPDIFTYFCHSYYVVPREPSVVIGATEYGLTFASMVQQGNIYGMQFHPEKSQDVGLKLLRNFVTSC
jgi:glutamine amidotransferase